MKPLIRACCFAILIGQCLRRAQRSNTPNVPILIEYPSCCHLCCRSVLLPTQNLLLLIGIMSKRPGGFNLQANLEKRKKLDAKIGSSGAGRGPTNPFLSKPVKPEHSIATFLHQVRHAARSYLPPEMRKFPIKTPFCEVEARLGILHISGRRVTSSGAKSVNGHSVMAFDCSKRECGMLSGVSRSHFARTTGAGLGEVSALSKALGVTKPEQLKRDLVETIMVETVYTGYPNDGRACFDGEHPVAGKQVVGKLESKKKLTTMNITIPAANFDLRATLSSEKVMDAALKNPREGWKSKRIKRRRSYARRDKSIKWQIDITEVTTIERNNTSVDYEVEMELLPEVLLQLINTENDDELKRTTQSLASQLWWIMTQLNPLKDAVDVEEVLRDHPDKTQSQLALAQCGYFRKFMDEGASVYQSPIATQTMTSSLVRTNFIGCMPVNFSRHNLEEIQRAPDNAYFLSEKTDGVRHFMVFTGATVVLVDRANKCKTIITEEKKEPFSHLLKLVKPGTVFDGEVVMNRQENRKPRPVFIVFDVLSTSVKLPCLQLPFEQRLKQMRTATFKQPDVQGNVFDPSLVNDTKIALPLVLKNFVTRSGVDSLLMKVHEERGMRCYRDGATHNHLTDGIIFQPNKPYVCGTDRSLLKWKYLDTVTVDIEIQPLRASDDDDVLRVACLGEDGTRVDMTRQVSLPKSERLRMEADKTESGLNIAEVGFDPETADWYYVTMRQDKTTPNHISTVLGSFLELGECLTTEELRYRMNVPAGGLDTYRKDVRRMLRQLLDHQRRQLHGSAPGGR